MFKLSLGAFCILGLLLSPIPHASAQDAGRDVLIREQQRLLDMLIRDPANIDLMFEYSVVSLRLQDYEAAIATLERMLVYRSDLTNVRFELAAAYFNLGSYDVAELYFNEVLEDPDLPDGTRSRVQQYLSEIKSRTARSSLRMLASVGITYATNANLGPLSDEVTVGGVPGFVLDPSSRSQSDFGVRAMLSGTHAFDLQGPNTDSWYTHFGLFALRYFDVEEGNTIYSRIRTGPLLSLDEAQFGPKIRPYLEGQYLNADDDTVYWYGAGGVEYTMALDRSWAMIADVGAGYYDFASDRNGEDAVSGRALIGAAYQPNRDLVARLSAFVERDAADADFNSNVEFGVRGSAEYQYDSGLDFVDRKWAISAYADVRSRWYDEPDAFIDPTTTRRDVDISLGVGHVFEIRDGIGIRLDVEGFKRLSSIDNYDLENLSVTLSTQFRF